MSVVVRIEMPENCGVCPFMTEYSRCAFLGMYAIDEERRADNCPILCQLPEGHGRLGDLDAFEKDVSNALVYGLKEIPNEEGKQIFHVLMQEVLDNVKKRETIVPADTAERSET